MIQFLSSPARWPLVLVFFYVVGAAAHAWGPLRGLMLLLTPGFLLVSGGFMVLAHLRQSVGQPLWRWFVPTALITLGLEILGVATGLVFGPYHYTEVLGPGVAGVPLVIGLNWVVVVLGFQVFVQRWSLSIPLRSLVVGLLCVAFDVALEPVAIHLGYWVWHGGDVPLQNYVAWGVIGAAASWGGSLVWKGRLPLTLGWYVLLQTGFFLTLNLWILLKWIP